MDRSVLARKPMTELKDIAAHLEMRGYQKLRKAELIDAIIGHATGGATGAGQQALDTGAAADGPAGTPAEEPARKVLPPGTVPEPPAEPGPPVEPEPAVEPEPVAEAEVPAEPAAADDDPAPEPAGEDDGPRRSRRDRRTRKRERERAAVEEADGRADQPEVDGGRAAAGQPAQGGGQQGGQQGGGQQGGGQQGGGQQRGRQQGQQGGTPNPDPGEVRAGVLDILPEGYGFLRTTGYLPGERDVYVSQGQIRKHGLRRGDVVQGPIRQQRSNEKVPALHHVQKVNGEPLEAGQVPARPAFDDLPIAVEPDRLRLAAGEGASTTARLVDLLAPLGMGARTLVVAPPRAEKERLVAELAEAIADAAPDAHVMLVVLDERPEAVARTADLDVGERITSTFDQPAEDHAQIAELAFERARRMVELGHDVVVLVDSMTRLARAHGASTTAGGRAIAPGVEAASLYPVKRMLAAARRVEGGGSLTVIATALSGTGSAIDEVILQELRRTATTEIVLDEELGRRRTWPAISVTASDARDDAGLHDDRGRAALVALRRALDGLSAADASALLLDKLAQVEADDDLLAQLLHADLAAASAGGAS